MILAMFSKCRIVISRSMPNALRVITISVTTMAKPEKIAPATK